MLGSVTAGGRQRRANAGLKPARYHDGADHDDFASPCSTLKPHRAARRPRALEVQGEEEEEEEDHNDETSQENEDAEEAPLASSSGACVSPTAGPFHKTFASGDGVVRLLVDYERSSAKYGNMSVLCFDPVFAGDERRGLMQQKAVYEMELVSKNITDMMRSQGLNAGSVTDVLVYMLRDVVTNVMDECGQEFTSRTGTPLDRIKVYKIIFTRLLASGYHQSMSALQEDGDKSEEEQDFKHPEWLCTSEDWAAFRASLDGAFRVQGTSFEAFSDTTDGLLDTVFQSADKAGAALLKEREDVDPPTGRELFDMTIDDHHPSGKSRKYKEAGITQVNIEDKTNALGPEYTLCMSGLRVCWGSQLRMASGDMTELMSGMFSRFMRTTKFRNFNGFTFYLDRGYGYLLPVVDSLGARFVATARKGYRGYTSPVSWDVPGNTAHEMRDWMYVMDTQGPRFFAQVVHEPPVGPPRLYTVARERDGKVFSTVTNDVSRANQVVMVTRLTAGGAGRTVVGDTVEEREEEGDHTTAVGDSDSSESEYEDGEDEPTGLDVEALGQGGTLTDKRMGVRLGYAMHRSLGDRVNRSHLLREAVARMAARPTHKAQHNSGWFYSKSMVCSSTAFETFMRAHANCRVAEALTGKRPSGVNVAGLVRCPPNVALGVTGARAAEFIAVVKRAAEGFDSATEDERLRRLAAQLGRSETYFDRAMVLLGVRGAPSDVDIKRVSGAGVPPAVKDEQLKAAVSKLGGEARGKLTRSQLVSTVERLKAEKAEALLATAPRLLLEGPLALRRFKSTDAMERGTFMEPRVRQAVPAFLRNVGESLASGADEEQSDPGSSAAAVNPFAFVSDALELGLWQHRVFRAVAASMDGYFIFSQKATPDGVEDVTPGFLEIKMVQGAKPLQETLKLARDAQYLAVTLHWSDTDEELQDKLRAICGTRQKDKMQLLHELSVVGPDAHVFYMHGALDGSIMRVCDVTVDAEFAERHLEAVTTALAAHAPFMLSPDEPVPQIENKYGFKPENVEFARKLALRLPKINGLVPEHDKVLHVDAADVNAYKSAVDVTTLMVNSSRTRTSGSSPRVTAFFERLDLLTETALQVFRINKVWSRGRGKSARGWASKEQVIRDISRVGASDVLRRAAARQFKPAHLVVANPVTSTSSTAERMVAVARDALTAEFRLDDDEFCELFVRTRSNVLSTSAGHAEKFMTGVHDVVRRSLRLPHCDFDHGVDMGEESRRCVICCHHCYKGRTGAHSRQGYEVLSSCRTCQVQLCSTARRGQWPGDVSCLDYFHSHGVSPHPFSGRKPEKGATMVSSAALRSDAAQRAHEAGKTESARKRRRPADGDVDYHGAPMHKSSLRSGSRSSRSGSRSSRSWSRGSRGKEAAQLDESSSDEEGSSGLGDSEE